eukprot:jgi/Orpsp1_1/1187744/evm.model.d7180000059844.1
MSFQPVDGNDPLRSPDYMEEIIINNNDDNDIDKQSDDGSFKKIEIEYPNKQNLIQSAGNEIDCSFVTPPEPNIKNYLKPADINSISEYGINKRSIIRCCDLVDTIFKYENYNDYQIEITQAEKMNNFTSSYIAYTIQTVKKEGHQVLFETKRRYSEFDMLQKHLIARFPTLIVPPIPGKSNIIEYATGSGKNQKDTMVEKRKRMLQTFLNKLRKHPVFCRIHIIHLFIQQGAQWSSKQDIVELKEGSEKIVSCID